MIDVITSFVEGATIDSTSVRNVDKASSVNILSVTIDCNKFFVTLTMDYISPPTHEAERGLNFDVIYLSLSHFWF